MKYLALTSLALIGAACSNETIPEPPTPDIATSELAAPEQSTPQKISAVRPSQMEMYMLDCGRIEISDLDAFSSAGDYAGQSDVYASTCWLIRHPEATLLWDLGLPSGLAGQDAQQNGVYTITLERTLTEQLAEIDLTPDSIDLISISHSHLDHTGQIDQFPNAKWLVHADEYGAMFPETGPEAAEETPSPYINYSDLERETFSGQYDVFGDGSVQIIPTPGHTPGHTSLWVDLQEMGPVLLSGDLYHRRESRELRRVPRFNANEAETLTSMDKFEALAEQSGARVIIQHEMADKGELPAFPEKMQ